ncbi:uncharacterized protein BXZ73DRAFT_106973 [Epithele typhae]|uniref:uncharacterized protein n=1 Tax=Epithele typhae TaxID=378194 RepID=UPI002007DD3D|nr:uncharacterized protein BXZ73DRAFT_106973 [Epithele typhae]KAH9913325.1 hypothetical protein BXZ73DRAFT_106973 [Epithele typhae]
MFVAMCATADLLDLDHGRRYVFDAIHKCVAQAAGKPERERDKCLAVGLERQATAWVAYMLWPFAAMAYVDDTDHSSSWDMISTPTAPMTSEDAERHRAHCPWKSLLLRDRYTCFFNKALDKECPQEYRSRLNFDYASRLQAAHIFNIAAVALHPESNELQSLSTTLGILQDYCRIHRSVVQTIINTPDNAQNSLLLSVEARLDFDGFNWCLKATKTPHRYRICYMPDNERYEGRRATSDHVTFADHSAEFDAPKHVTSSSPIAGVALPNADLLRMHCALAHVLHLSGAAELFEVLAYTADHVSPTGAAFMARVVDEDPYAVIELQETLAEMLNPQ